MDTTEQLDSVDEIAQTMRGRSIEDVVCPRWGEMHIELTGGVVVVIIGDPGFLLGSWCRPQSYH